MFKVKFDVVINAPNVKQAQVIAWAIAHVLRGMAEVDDASVGEVVEVENGSN